VKLMVGEALILLTLATLVIARAVNILCGMQNEEPVLKPNTFVPGHPRGGHAGRLERWGIPMHAL
jgi:hypothetical protein